MSRTKYTYQELLIRKKVVNTGLNVRFHFISSFQLNSEIDFAPTKMPTFINPGIDFAPTLLQKL